MATVAKLLSFASGFALTGYKGDPLNLAATSIAINLSLAPLIAVIALRRGRSWIVWAALGVCLGMWALVTLLIFIPKRNQKPPASPSFTTSHAA